MPVSRAATESNFRMQHRVDFQESRYISGVILRPDQPRVLGDPEALRPVYFTAFQHGPHSDYTPVGYCLYFFYGEDKILGDADSTPLTATHAIALAPVSASRYWRLMISRIFMPHSVMTRAIGTHMRDGRLRLELLRDFRPDGAN